MALSNQRGAKQEKTIQLINTLSHIRTNIRFIVDSVTKLEKYFSQYFYLCNNIINFSTAIFA